MVIVSMKKLIRFCNVLFFIWFAQIASTSSFSQTKPQTARAKKPNDVLVRGKLGLSLDNFLSRAEKFGYQGIVLAAKNGQVVLKKAYGFADRENGCTRYSTVTKSWCFMMEVISH